MKKFWADAAEKSAIKEMKQLHDQVCLKQIDISKPITWCSQW